MKKRILMIAFAMLSTVSLGAQSVLSKVIINRLGNVSKKGGELLVGY